MERILVGFRIDASRSASAAAGAAAELPALNGSPLARQSNQWRHVTETTATSGIEHEDSGDATELHAREDGDYYRKRVEVDAMAMSLRYTT